MMLAIPERGPDRSGSGLQAKRAPMDWKLGRGAQARGDAGDAETASPPSAGPASDAGDAGPRDRWLQTDRPASDVGPTG
jgi:hypothetical protein